MFRFVHIGLVFPGVPKMRDLEPVFNELGGDWVRYAHNNWIMWTDKPVGMICTRLLSNLDPQDQVLVVDLNMSQSFGRLSPWIWTWINSKQTDAITSGDELARRLQTLLPKSGL